MYVFFKILFTIPLIWSTTAYIDPSTIEGKLGDHIKKTHDLCVDVTGATEDQIQQVRLGNFPDDERIKRCFPDQYDIPNVLVEYEIHTGYIRHFLKNQN
ncbi:hypothetical protein JTB14_018106 [Gonioctena quinquepunctata]|nr:hypothetical protein JTB14_018106 [Gonioctena quinquepunctata]